MMQLLVVNCGDSTVHAIGIPQVCEDQSRILDSQLLEESGEAQRNDE
jgi:hypothetical protein